jgi:hypothetical protein
VSEVPGALSSTPPAVHYHEFTDAGVRLAIAVRVRSFVDQAPVKDALIRQLHSVFAREGIGPPITRAMTVNDRRDAPAPQ